MNNPNTAMVEMPEATPACPDNAPVPQPSQQKKGPTTYICLGCGHEATANEGVETEEINGRKRVVDADMWAEAVKVAEPTIKPYCKACVEDGKGDGDVFFPLREVISFVWRIRRKERAAKQAAWEKRQIEINEIKAKAAKLREAERAEIEEIEAKAREQRWVDAEQKRLAWVAEIRAGIGQKESRRPGSTVVYRPGHEPAATPGTGSIHAQQNGKDRKAS